MKRIFLISSLSIFLLASCIPALPPLPERVIIPTNQDNDISEPSATAIVTSEPIQTPTPSPLLLDQPVFLAWPLPANIGTPRISQYPNTPWTWNYLGLNPGYQCPPMFGYLADVSSWPYWRDVNILEDEDKALADPHNFEMVACYSTDDGPAGSNGHAGTDIKASAGTPVYAAAYGKIMVWRLTGNNNMVVLKHCLGGSWTENGECVDGRQWYTTYMHINPDESLLVENKSIPQGTELGTIYDQSINSHLHFEVGEGTRGYTSYVNPWGADEAPWLGCMWLDHALCVNPDVDYQRMLVSLTSGEVLLQSGTQAAGTIPEMHKANRIRLWGNRLAFLDEVNSLFVGDLSAGTWQMAAEDLQDFQISDTRTAVLDMNNNLYVREELPVGGADSWQFLASDVRAFALSDTRVGYVDDESLLFVKEGSLDGDWVQVAENAQHIQVVDNRIAYLNRQNVLYVNEGMITSEFEEMSELVRAFEVTNVRLGMINSAGQFLVKEGNLRADWVLQGEGVQAFQLADVRMMMQDDQGIFFSKTGNLYQEWFGVPFADLQMVYLNGEMPVYVE
ncbi:MAG: M23 family metallopeptidase [Anaerolineaceae bacterium]|nr:M23 family metallopeptidase [Anaerolineaceae bacterium]